MKEAAAHYDLVRKINVINTIAYFQDHNLAMKSEVAQYTNLSLPTVGSILSLLLDTGEIIRYDHGLSSGGRPAERFAINPLNSLSLAVVLQLGNVEYVVADSLGNIISRYSVQKGEEFTLALLEKFLHKAIGEFPSIKIISIGVPGSIHDGVLYLMPNQYKALNGVKLEEYISDLYQLPTIVENDLNAIVQGQYLRNYDGMMGGVVHFFATEDGIGLGINANGQLVRGDTGFAGEIGFLPCYNDKNVRQAMDEAQSKEDLLDVLARVLVATSCLLNPRYFFLSGERMSEDLIPDLKECALAFWPRIQMPEILYVEDVISLYFIGLIDMARKKYYSPEHIQLAETQ